MPARRRKRQQLRAQVRQKVAARVVEEDPPEVAPRRELEAAERLGWLGHLAKDLLVDANPAMYERLLKEGRLQRHLWEVQDRGLDRLVEALQAGMPWAQAVEQAIDLEVAPPPMPERNDLPLNDLTTPAALQPA